MTDHELETDIQRYRGMLYRLAYSYSGSHPDSEDITQEAFIRLYRHSRGFESEEAKKAWLIRVTVNMCKNRNMLKWNRSRSELDGNESCSGGLSDEYIDLKNALKKLKPEQRTVIYMYYYEGYRTDEIARCLGISATAVTTRLQRGRDKLRGFLGND